MSYDPRCYDLAVLFLSDSPEKDTEANRDKLAQHIQTEIESEIEFILEPVTNWRERAEHAESVLAEQDLAEAPRS